MNLQENKKKLLSHLLKPHVSLTNEDILTFPSIRLLKSQFISLHDKHDGILCPATYMGNLSVLPETKNIIAIYSRSDDKNIAEKIIGGALAYQYLIQNFSNNFLSIVMQEDSKEKEIFHLDDYSSKSDIFFNYAEKFLQENKNYRTYK